MAPGPALAAAVDMVVDPSYGIAGQARAGLSNVRGVGAATDGTGRRIVLGQDTAGGVRLARFLVGGEVDPSFGPNGRRTVAVPPRTTVTRIRIRPDGRLWIAGSADRKVVVVRLTATGAPDATFGSGGTAVYDPLLPSQYDLAVHDLAPTAAGGVTVAASGIERTGLVSRVVVRLTATGHPDSTFGAGGRAILPMGLDLSARPRTILQLSSGEVALTLASPQASTVVRLNANGRPDQAFGAGGVSLAPGSGPRVLDGLAEGTGSSVVAAGYTDGGFLLTRLLANGQLDATFGTGGLATIEASGCESHYAELALDHAGRYWVSSTRECGVTGAEFARFLASGRPDTTFGTAGYLEVHQHDIDPDGDLFGVGGRSLWFDAEGRVVFGADSTTYLNDGTQQDLASWRLAPAGLVDGDVTGDARTDIAVWRPTNGTWYVQGAAPVPWGTHGDVPLTGHFVRGVPPAGTTAASRARAAAAKNSARSDLVVWRPANRTWYIRGLDPIPWGQRGDLPVAGDYNGDGTSDLAVWRPANGKWYVRGANPVSWGLPGDVPVAGDFTGDGITDYTVWRPSTGRWYIRGAGSVPWGQRGDVPVAGDFNGDGRTDIAIWRPSTGQWHVRGANPVSWGLHGDVPLCGDFNGDGVTDYAVWRPSNRTWYVRGLAPIAWGQSGDVPVPRAKR